ncbi:MAG: DnaB-like helicase N-terminal domain-containing protein [Planctomycetota bacterium]|jgi:replicative DNA helicase
MARAYSGPKIPPYAIVSEKKALGAMLRTPGLVDEVRELIPSGACFFRLEHGKLYDTLLEIGGRAVGEGLDTLIERVEACGVLDSIGGPRFIHGLADDAPDRAAALKHAENIAEKARMRELIDAAADILHDAYHTQSSFDEILKKAKKKFNALARKAKPKS